EGQSGNDKLGAAITIDTLVADRTVLEFAPKPPDKSAFVLTIHHARLSPVSGDRALNFETDVHVPTPPGEVHAAGSFGPWNLEDPFATAVSGSYDFDHADLGFARGIAGILHSHGEYRGSIRHIEVSGSAAVPDFRVTAANHPVGLTVRFQAI